MANNFYHKKSNKRELNFFENEILFLADRNDNNEGWHSLHQYRRFYPKMINYHLLTYFVATEIYMMSIVKIRPRII